MGWWVKSFECFSHSMIADDYQLPVNKPIEKPHVGLCENLQGTKKSHGLSLFSRSNCNVGVVFHQIWPSLSRVNSDHMCILLKFHDFHHLLFPKTHAPKHPHIRDDTYHYNPMYIPLYPHKTCWWNAHLSSCSLILLFSEADDPQNPWIRPVLKW